MNEQALILIVDDMPLNLQILGNILDKNNYRTALAQNGEQVLNFVKKKLPDLILLDVMMPGIDGFMVCKILQQNPLTCEIPIIFITAKTEKEDIVKGLECGAVDYITKPFNSKELITRVNTHLDLKTAKIKLSQKITELKQANATKDKIFSIITHDLKDLFNVLLGFSEELMINMNIDVSEKKDIQIIQQISQQGNNLLTNLLTWSRLQTETINFQPEKLNLFNVFAGHISLETYAKTKNIKIYNNIPTDILIFINEKVLNIIIHNLLSNAIKFTPKNGTITISSYKKYNKIETLITDTGVGIKPQNLDKVFRVDTNYKTSGTDGENGTGLGLILCKELIDKHDGSIWVESEENKGSKFYFTFPVYQLN